MEHISKVLPGAVKAHLSAMQDCYGNSSTVATATTWTALKLQGRVHEDINSPKAKLWMREFSKLSEEELLYGLEVAPSFRGFFDLSAFVELCHFDEKIYGIPDALNAYREACNRPSPKIKQKWTHPIVYHCGVQTGWFELHELPEKRMYPVFKRNYEILTERVKNGEDLGIDVPKAIPQHIPEKTGKEKTRSRIAKMKAELNL